MIRELMRTAMLRRPHRECSRRGLVAAALLTGAVGTRALAQQPTAVTTPRIPVVVGLTVLTAVNTPMDGDYETLKRVESIAHDGSVDWSIAGQSRNPIDRSMQQFVVERTVLAADLRAASTYKYLFANEGARQYAGTTAIGTSAAVLEEIRATRHATVRVDGEAPGMAGVLSGVLGMITGSDSGRGPSAGPNASGTLALVEPRPVPFPVIINGARGTLSAWHLHGRLTKGDQPADVDWYLLDDPANPLTLRYTIADARLEVVRIQFPTPDDAKTVERSLATERRATLYGIYFDFNQATIRSQSEPVLREIVEVMRREPSWTLRVEGHTDNVGGDAKNLDLSTRRAAAVKAALVQRGVPAGRLDTGGYGASVPRETNATLAGRARNRRVELTRQ